MNGENNIRCIMCNTLIPSGISTKHICYQCLTDLKRSTIYKNQINTNKNEFT